MHFMVLVEFHHAAAPSYAKLLTTLKPEIFVGLTATPERMDGKNILDLFQGHISAEIRLPEAIERKLLVPFHYFGISDSVDLTKVTWSRNGYDASELSELYSHNHQRAYQIIQSVRDYCGDIENVKALGFCVSKEHARFMADCFNEAGIPSISLTADSKESVRQQAKEQLVSGEIKCIFVVDLYNEGVDIPEVNTVLFLRPTQSLTIFLQQLGRGLRLAEKKECLTVLDFIGAAHARYDFEGKFNALLTGSRPLLGEVKNGFNGVPKGCSIQLEKLASTYVINNIKKSIATRKGIQQRMQTFEQDTGKPLNLANFLHQYHLQPKQLYKFGSFYQLACAAGLFEEDQQYTNDTLFKTIGKFASADSKTWITYLQNVLEQIDTFDPAKASPEEKRMLDMFFQTIFQKNTETLLAPANRSQLKKLQSNPLWQKEMKELLDYQLDTVDYLEIPYKEGVPLTIHSTYTRDQLLSGLGYEKPQNIREGVKWLEDQKTDVLLVTLHKAEKEYSPSTMYNDYSINENLFHWQSQSLTSETSNTGQSYIHHADQGSEVLLFVRESKTDPLTGGAMPYTFLGPVSYVSHTGSKPMSIIWDLKYPIPAKYLKTTNQLLA